MSFFWKGRLNAAPSDLLKHYYAEQMREPDFLDALHQWDKAQVVVLGEQELAPPETIAALLDAVAEMEKDGVGDQPEEFAAFIKNDLESLVKSFRLIGVSID